MTVVQIRNDDRERQRSYEVTIRLHSIYEPRRVHIMSDASAAGSRADYRTDLREFKHERKGLGGREVLLVGYQYLCSRPRVHRSRYVVAFAKLVIVERFSLEPFDKIVRCNAAAVVSLIDN